MGDAFRSTLAAEAAGKSAQISGLYLGAVIIVSCAVSVTPIELFIIEVWPRHGLFSLLLFVAPLIAGWVFARLLPERYYRIKPCESSGRVYERLGIRSFKRFVPNGDYVNRIIRRSDSGYRVVWDEESIVRFEARTRLAEKCHLAGLWLALQCAVYALLSDWNKFALWLLLPNLPFHIYPILLQRYTRARIQRVLNRAKRKG
jgi:hypothetical protein